MTPDLCQTMSLLAEETWEHLELGPKLGYGQPDERALMDHHLIELCRRHRDRVVAAKFDQVEETATGADFEWWLRDGQSYLGLRVQAKKLDLARGTYRQLRHRTEQHVQVDQLIADSEQRGLIPMYLFFTGPTDQPMNDRCPRRERLADRGCSIARADEIKKLAQSQPPTAANVASVSWPWRCATCCTRHPGLGPTERLMRLLEEGGILAGGLWSSPPDYVAAVAGGSLEPPADAEMKPRVSGPSVSRVLVMSL